MSIESTPTTLPRTLSINAVFRFADEIEAARTDRSWDLRDCQELEPGTTVALRALADRADAVGATITLTVDSPAVLAQLDCERLHRRFPIVRPETTDTPAAAAPDAVDLADLAEVQQWRSDIESVTKRLATEDTDVAAFLLRWIVANEDFLYSQNQISPSRDLVPKLIESLDRDRLVALLERQTPSIGARILLGDHTRVPDDSIADLLGRMDAASAAELVQAMAVGIDRPARIAPIIGLLDRDAAARILDETPPTTFDRIIEGADTVSEALAALRQAGPKTLIRLIETVCENATPERWRRGAALLSSVLSDVRDATVAELSEEIRLGLVDVDEFCTADVQSRKWFAPDAVASFASGWGTRTVTDTSAGRAITIDEQIDSEFGRKRVRIDLLELDPARLQFATYLSPQERPDHDAVRELFAPYDESGSPPESVFRDAGLFRLREAVEETGAVAAINGSFHFDYGHYIYGRQIGVDLSDSPGLRFGDPVGWLVHRGRELSPPIFNRASFVVTDDDAVHIRRVRMTAARFGDTRIAWDVDNDKAGPRQVGFFTSIQGFLTPDAPDHTDCVVLNGTLVRIHPGGGAAIPFTGFVISLPNDHPALASRVEGEPVVVENDFGRSDVREAMACGPQLVRDGRIEVDFRLEEFGKRDSAVMSFFLPRLFESYDAARSFLGLRGDGTVVLGTVSGRSLGSGDRDQPSGLTFGELARLALDLGLTDAMGLDGGASSSLVVRTDDGPRLLNVPTGGADVPRGCERFISTGLIVHDRG